MTTNADPTAALERDFEAIALCIHARLFQAADVGLSEVRLRTATLPADHPARQRLASLERELAAASETPPAIPPGSDLGFCATCGDVIEFVTDHWRHLHVVDHAAVLKF